MPRLNPVGAQQATLEILTGVPLEHCRWLHFPTPLRPQPGETEPSASPLDLHPALIIPHLPPWPVCPSSPLSGLSCPHANSQLDPLCGGLISLMAYLTFPSNFTNVCLCVNKRLQLGCNIWEEQKKLGMWSLFTFVYVLCSTFCSRTVILCLCHWEIVCEPRPSLIMRTFEVPVTIQPPSQLCTCTNTELGCRAFTRSSSSPLYFFRYYTFTYLLYLSVGIQTCHGAPVEVRGRLREGSQSSPSSVWILGSVFKLKSKCLSLLSHLTSATLVY